MEQLMLYIPQQRLKPILAQHLALYLPGMYRNIYLYNYTCCTPSYVCGYIVVNETMCCFGDVGWLQDL